MIDRAFSFLRSNAREGKPRTRGLTEIRGPYYTPIGKRYLEDVLETIRSCSSSALRAGIWDTTSLWGRVVTYKE